MSGALQTEASAEARPQRSYYPHMDGLRTVAISLVLIEHFGGPLGSFWSAAYYGVDLFFVISGFLITGILIRDPESSFRTGYTKFMGRRVLRIFPVYYLALLVLWLVDFPQARSNLLYLLTYTWNYATVHIDGENYLFYLWSLAVEEQFYLFWPFVALSLRRRLRTLLVVTLGIVIVGYLQVVTSFLEPLQPYNYVGLINRMGSLGLGSAGAIAVALGLIPRAWYSSRALETLTLLTLAWALLSDQPIRLPALGLCSLVLVTKSVEGRFRTPGLARALGSKLGTHVGRISYGVYVYHWPLGVGLTWLVFDPIWARIDFAALGPLAVLRWNSWLVKLPLFSAVSLVAAHLSHRFFERPILRLKDRWFPTGQSPAQLEGRSDLESGTSSAPRKTEVNSG